MPALFELGDKRTVAKPQVVRFAIRADHAAPSYQDTNRPLVRLSGYNLVREVANRLHIPPVFRHLSSPVKIFHPHHTVILFYFQAQRANLDTQYAILYTPYYILALSSNG